MKKILIALFLVFVCSVCYAETTSFLTEKEISTEFLSLPPKPEEASFYNDWQRYQWGKTMRDTKRGKQAIKDADYTLENLAKIYSKPFGMEISEKNTPEIWALLDRVLVTADLCKDKAKSRIMRNRPFIQFNEPTPIPKDEEELKDNSSYPSGHTTRGWAVALVLAQINPERQNEILKRGIEYGESRVIVGFHFQSDVDAAIVITSAFINRLNINEEFKQQFGKAKAEFQQKKSKWF